MPAKWTEDEDLKVLELVRQSLTYVQMAEHLARSPGAISYRYLNYIRPRLGGPKMLLGAAPQRPWTVEESRDAFALREHGHSLPSIANTLGRSRFMVRSHLANRPSPEQLVSRARRQATTWHNRVVTIHERVLKCRIQTLEEALQEIAGPHGHWNTTDEGETCREIARHALETKYG